MVLISYLVCLRDQTQVVRFDLVATALSSQVSIKARSRVAYSILELPKYKAYVELLVLPLYCSSVGI